MAITSQERVGKALEFLRLGLAPYVEREFANAHEENGPAETRRLLPAEDRSNVAARSPSGTPPRIGRLLPRT